MLKIRDVALGLARTRTSHSSTEPSPVPVPAQLARVCPPMRCATTPYIATRAHAPSGRRFCSTVRKRLSSKVLPVPGPPKKMRGGSPGGILPI